jgi:hypothetical protein
MAGVFFHGRSSPKVSAEGWRVNGMADTPKLSRRLIDGHTHIGALGAFKYYDLKEPLNVTVYEFADTKDYIKNHLDKYNIERSLVISNYGVPIQEQPFSLNPLVIESTQARTACMARSGPRGSPGTAS